MAADLTLYGNNDSDLTTFLWPNTTYVMTLTQNGQSTSLEFELPAYMTDKIVTSVDTTNNTITVVSSLKTGETGLLWNDADGDEIFDIGEEEEATFNVAGKYEGNLGTLIGRTVNFQYDTDANLTAFSLDDADVVYGAMQYVNDGTAPKDGYFKDKITGTKYKNSATSSSTKNVTRMFNAYDGDLIGVASMNGTPAPQEIATGDYQYVKLVLNPDGTVSTANIDTVLDIPLFVTEIDGTKAIQDKNNGVDLDGYIIVKDDEYVKPADLELGDVVFVDATNKFADVYNNEVSGEISNVISGKLDIDNKTYEWNKAQYYDESDDVYKKLSTTGTANETSQNYLNSLDPDVDTTIWLNRFGKIAYIDGTETGVVNTTDVTYLVIENAQSYQESLRDMIKIKVFNGTEKETLAIKVDDLKYYNGNAGEYTATTFNASTNQNIAFTAKPADATKNLGATAIGNLFPAGELMVVTYNEDGKAIGLKAHQSIDITTGTIDNKNILKTASSPNLSKDTTVVTTAVNAATDHKWSTGSYTNLWIWNMKYPVSSTDASDGTDAFTMVPLTDFDNEIITTAAATSGAGAAQNFVSLAYRADGTKATDLVVKIGSYKAFKGNETNTIYGMLTGTTKKNNSDNTAQVINTITILSLDGTKATYYGDGELTAVSTAHNGDFVALTQDKVTELITGATVEGEWEYGTGGAVVDGETGKLAANRDYDSEKLVLSDGKELTYAEGGSILLRYTEEGSVKHKVVTYSDVNVIKQEMNVWYDNTFVDSTGKKIQSAMIVVQTVGTPQAAYVTLNDIADAVKFATGTIGTANVLDTSVSDTVTYTLKQLKPGDTSATTAGTLAVEGAALKASADIALHAGYSYWVLIDTNNNTDYSDASSNVVVADDAFVVGFSTDNTYANIAPLAVTTSNKTVNADDASDDACVVGTAYAFDQFEDLVKSESDGVLTVEGAATTAKGSFTYTTDADGKVTSLKYTSSGSTTHAYNIGGTTNTVTVSTHA